MPTYSLILLYQRNHQSSFLNTDAVEQEKAKARERESSIPATTSSTAASSSSAATLRTRTTSSSSGTKVVENNDDPYVVGDRAVTGRKASGGSSRSISSSSHSTATATASTAGSSLGTDADTTMAPVSCRRSFEPTCEMYPYVRFWNRQFSSEDCYLSPLRHPNGINILTELNLPPLNPPLSHTHLHMTTYPLRHPNGINILTEHNLTQLNPQLST